MKKINYFVFTILFLFIIFISPELSAKVRDCPLEVGTDLYNFNIQMDSFILNPKNSPFKLQIDLSYLPGTEKLHRVPTVYLTDGQWRRMDHKYVHYLTYKKIIPPVVVVGIGYPEEYDAGQVRVTDLLIRADNFLKTIQKEIIPAVEKRFDTDPNNRILFGASYGGYYSAYAFLTNALAGDSSFKSYIGSSPYLPGTNIYKLANKLASQERMLSTNLYLAYGDTESVSEYDTPNRQLNKILESPKLKGLNFIHHVYPGGDHYNCTRMTLIDGLRLFLGNNSAKGVGASDLSYATFTYDFKTTTQLYDWNTNFYSDLSYSPNFSGSAKVHADFSKYSSLKFETSSVFFEKLADREIEFNIFIPEDLAKLNYKLKFHIYSTFDMPWIMDTSEDFKISKSGWNTFKYKWRGHKISGNIDCIRGFGVSLEKGKQSPPWKGTLYFDNIKW